MVKDNERRRTAGTAVLPSSGFVRMQALLPPYGPIPACRATIYSWIRAGLFPAPVPIGPGRIKGFRVEDVRAFLAHPNVQTAGAAVVAVGRPSQSASLDNSEEVPF